MKYLKAIFAAIGAGLLTAQGIYIARGHLTWYDAIPIGISVTTLGGVVWGVPNATA